MRWPAFFFLAISVHLGAGEFRYQEDFENTDPVLFWTSNGSYELRFKGITEEDAHEGRRSLKINVTFQGASYVYFRVPLRVPVEGRLRFSGWIKVIESSPGASRTERSGDGPEKSLCRHE